MSLRLLVMGVVLALPMPMSVYAQEAAISGTATDATGLVLPGVAVTAVHGATGNIFETVTDATGAYRIPARIGVYQITAQLPGFSTVMRSGVQLLVGQTVVVNLQLHVSTLLTTLCLRTRSLTPFACSM